jgi:hypothetical protein
MATQPAGGCRVGKKHKAQPESSLVDLTAEDDFLLVVRRGHRLRVMTGMDDDGVIDLMAVVAAAIMQRLDRVEAPGVH